MKAKSLLLAGLASFALSSCGGVKGYKTEVKSEVFIEEIEKILNNSVLLDTEENYSFVYETSKEYKTVETYLKNGNEFSETVLKTKSESELRYDSENAIVRSKGTYDNLLEKEDDKRTEHTIGEMVYQKDKKNFYEVNLKTKLYKKTASSKPENGVKSVAQTMISSIRSALSIMRMSGSDIKDYIDDNVYTCEITINEEDEKGKTVYQAVVENDKISIFYESKVTLKALNYTKITEDKHSSVLTKKNVSLDEVNLEKYLDITNND